MTKQWYQVVYVIQKSKQYGLKQEIPYKTLKHNQLSMVLERKKAVLSSAAFWYLSEGQIKPTPT